MIKTIFFNSALKKEQRIKIKYVNQTVNISETKFNAIRQLSMFKFLRHLITMSIYDSIAANPTKLSIFHIFNNTYSNVGE